MAFNVCKINIKFYKNSGDLQQNIKTKIKIETNNKPKQRKIYSFTSSVYKVHF